MRTGLSHHFGSFDGPSRAVTAARARRACSFHRRVRPPLSLVALLLTVLSTVPAPAAEAAPASAASLYVPAEWLMMIFTTMAISGLFGIAGFVNVVLSIWHKVRPKPPLHEQFAARAHVHPEYRMRREQDAHCEQAHAEFRGGLGAVNVNTEKLERKLDTLGDIFRVGLQSVEEKAEARASLIHSRINGISDPLSKLVGRVEDHVADNTRHYNRRAS